jgi:hypothetical protein
MDLVDFTVITSQFSPKEAGMREILVAMTFIMVLAGGALADRPVTEEEKTKLAAAVAAQGCSGGKKMEFDDGKFEVDDASCADGKKYDLDFDTSFQLIKKEVED